MQPIKPLKLSCIQVYNAMIYNMLAIVTIKYCISCNYVIKKRNK